MSVRFLKVKIAALTAEARAIKREERKVLSSGRWLRANQQAHKEEYDLYDSLRAHRRVDVRVEARAALLAYAILRGRTRDQVEPRSLENVRRNYPRQDKIVHNLQRFGLVPKEKWKAAHTDAVNSWLDRLGLGPAEALGLSIPKGGVRLPDRAPEAAAEQAA